MQVFSYNLTPFRFHSCRLAIPDRAPTCSFGHRTERESFENADAGMLAGWPEVGSRMMTRVMTGQDLCGVWVVVQDGVYRYRVDQCGTTRVRSILAYPVNAHDRYM